MIVKMRKKDTVVSLELAKRLKEAGVNSPSLFYWRIWDDKSVDIAMEHEDDFDYSGAGRKVVEKIPAYTATELIEKLPGFIRPSKNERYILSIHKFCDGYAVGYERCYDSVLKFFLQEFENEKLADALAQALIWWKRREKSNE